MSHSPGFLAIAAAAKRRIREVPASEMPALLADGAVLVDVREQSEWSAGHIVGAVWLGKGVLERDVERRFPDVTQPLYLYCGSGLRSALAADSLRSMGYQHAISVDGGYAELSRVLPTAGALDS